MFDMTATVRYERRYPATVNAPDDPRPVPAGMSAWLTFRRAQAQCFANQRVADFFQVGRLFQSGVFQQVAAAEPLVDADVDVFIDGGRDDESTEAAVVGGQVGAASAD